MCELCWLLRHALASGRGPRVLGGATGGMVSGVKTTTIPPGELDRLTHRYTVLAATPHGHEAAARFRTWRAAQAREGNDLARECVGVLDRVEGYARELGLHAMWQATAVGIFAEGSDALIATSLEDINSASTGSLTEDAVILPAAQRRVARFTYCLLATGHAMNAANDSDPAEDPWPWVFHAWDFERLAAGLAQASKGGKNKSSLRAEIVKAARRNRWPEVDDPALRSNLALSFGCSRQWVGRILADELKNKTAQP